MSERRHCFSCGDAIDETDDCNGENYGGYLNPPSGGSSVFFCASCWSLEFDGADYIDRTDPRSEKFFAENFE